MNDSVIGSLLQVFPFAGRLSPEASKAVRESASPQEFPAGAALLSEGQLCRSLLLVVRGAIRVFKAVPTGREITLYVVNPGESCLLGVSCLLTESRYPAQAATAKDTFAVAVPASVFRRIFASDPEVQQFVIGLFSKRLAGVMTLVEEVAFRRMDERLAAFLLHASAMVKDRKAAKTGGWIFSAYGPDRKPLGIDPVKACYECHAGGAKASDLVFSKWIE